MADERCPACLRFDAAERAAIEGSEMPEHWLDGCTCALEPTIAMTMLGPERLPIRPQRGIPVAVTFAELARWVKHPIVTADKAGAGGFVLALLRDGIRRKDHVESVSALALDHDAGTLTPQTAHERLRRYRHIVYSTWSSTPQAPRWRAILAVSRPMTPYEHGLVWNRCARVVERDAKVGGSTKDPCRLWYVPTIQRGATPVMYVGDGSPLNVERLIAKAGARPTSLSDTRSPDETGDKYMNAAIQRECENVAHAPEGMRNVVLNKAGYSLARLHISNLHIAKALLRAALSVGLPELEARKTIASALRGRRGPA